MWHKEKWKIYELDSYMKLKEKWKGVFVKTTISTY